MDNLIFLNEHSLHCHFAPTFWHLSSKLILLQLSLPLTWRITHTDFYSSSSEYEKTMPLCISILKISSKVKTTKLYFSSKKSRRARLVRVQMRVSWKQGDWSLFNSPDGLLFVLGIDCNGEGFAPLYIL